MATAPSLPRVEGRVPPHDPEAERSVLGAILLDPMAIIRVSEFLRPEHFYRANHGEVFRAALKLFSDGEPIDNVTLASELEKAGVLDRIGGRSYLAMLEQSVPTAANVEYYARIVREKHQKVRLISAGSDITQLGYEDGLEADEALNNAQALVFGIAEDRGGSDFEALDPLLKAAMDRIDAQMNSGRGVVGIPSGFYDLDTMTNGFKASELVIVAGRPSMGKTSLALNIALRAAVEEKKPVAIFSLEMSKDQITERMLCEFARIDAQRLHRGQLSDAEFGRLAEALGPLGQAPIFIDDTPVLDEITLLTKARRIAMREQIEMVVIDYLQLMHGRSRGDDSNRVQEVSAISRAMKALARELKVPVIAISQLSRAAEQRPDKRPMLSDLRESGCLAGDTRVLLPDEGAYVAMRDLVGKTDFRVLALNQATWKLEPKRVTAAFATGTKPVYLMRTRLGRTIRATANHKFRTLMDWRRLDDLSIGQFIALPRMLPAGTASSMTDAELALLGHLIGDGCTLPRHSIQYTTNDIVLAETVSHLAHEAFGDAIAPVVVRERGWYQVYLRSTRRLTHAVRNPVAKWLSQLGVFGLRSHEKRVPDLVFAQPADKIALFLRHLWSTDGCVHISNGYGAIYYASSSRLLASQVQSLLLRLGINARLTHHRSPGRPQYHVTVSGGPDLRVFLSAVGAIGQSKERHAAAIAQYLLRRIDNPNRDIIPTEIWKEFAKPAMSVAGLTTRAMQASLGNAYCGTTLYRQNVSRARAHRLANVVGSAELLSLSTSDVYWDEVVSIEEDGVEEVFDLTVEDHHNFVAGDIIVHNSIEQDADMVFLIFRPDYYKPEDKPGIAEIIIAKHRNGPTGTVELRFRKELTRFENLERRRAEPAFE